MTIIQKPTATVGQIVKDLELIVAKEPNILLDYSNVDATDMYVEGVKLRPIDLLNVAVRNRGDLNRFGKMVDVALHVHLFGGELLTLVNFVGLEGGSGAYGAHAEARCRGNPETGGDSFGFFTHKLSLLLSEIKN